MINRHPGVRASRVSGRKNPFTGSIVVADVVLEPMVGPANDNAGFKEAIMEACRAEAARAQGARHAALCARAGIDRGRKAEPAWRVRNVLVTGGTRGVGLAVASRLAADGFRVFALGRRESAGLTAAIAAFPSGVLNFVPFDLMHGRM